MAAGTKGAETVAAQMIDQRFAKNATAGISGA
jgi:hypothetical protein